jgi:hypothetical protein
MTRDPFSLHEILHTAHLVEEMFATHVLEREDVQNDPELKMRADIAHDALFAFYQFVGRISHEETR